MKAESPVVTQILPLEVSQNTTEDDLSKSILNKIDGAVRRGAVTVGSTIRVDLSWFRPQMNEMRSNTDYVDVDWDSVIEKTGQALEARVQQKINQFKTPPDETRQSSGDALLKTLQAKKATFIQQMEIVSSVSQPSDSTLKGEQKTTKTSNFFGRTRTENKSTGRDMFIPASSTKLLVDLVNQINVIEGQIGDLEQMLSSPKGSAIIPLSLGDVSTPLKQAWNSHTAEKLFLRCASAELLK